MNIEDMDEMDLGALEAMGLMKLKIDRLEMALEEIIAYEGNSVLFRAVEMKEIARQALEAK